MQKKTLDLVGIGECLVEFAEIGPGLYRQDYSGDVLNALWMASFLGLRTGLLSAVGDDPFTQGLLTVLDDARIDRSVVERIPGRINGIYYVLEQEGSKRFHFQRKNSAATQTFRSDADKLESYLRSSQYVLFSAIPLAVIEARQTMLQVLARAAADARMCFDTNVRVALWPDLTDLRKLIAKLSSIVSVLLVSREDDEALFGHREAAVAIEYYRDLGYSTIIFRRGSEATLAYKDGITVEVPTVAGVTVIDATGAGDAFNAGFIAAQIEQKDLETSIAFANAAAASVLGMTGGRAIGMTRTTVEQLASTIRHGAHA